MDLNEYQKLAMRTKKDNAYQLLLCEGSMGISGESGEVSDYIKKFVFHGHILDPMELAKELGDVMWYVAMIAETIGIPLNDVAEMNIEKLKRRYPEGFDSEKSIEREEVKVKIRKDIVLDPIKKFSYDIESFDSIIRVIVSKNFYNLLGKWGMTKNYYKNVIFEDNDVQTYKIYGIRDGKEVLIIGDKMPNTL